ncbi:hypothetical protein BSL78_19782, partial [Apostichopus japonicus]
MNTPSSSSSGRMPVPRRGIISFLQNTINPSLPRSSFGCNPNVPRLLVPSRPSSWQPDYHFYRPYQSTRELQIVNVAHGYPRVAVSDNYMASVKRTFEQIFSEENGKEKKFKPNSDSSSVDKFHNERRGEEHKGNKDLSTFKRKWRHVESKDAAKRNLKDFQFSVLCYNVLAQGLLDGNSYLYKQVHPQFLDWNFRKANLLQEMRCLNSDIICLQEVESEHYQNFFQPSLAKNGYTGIYKKRTGNKSDGCAIFFKSNKFQLVVSRVVSYYRRHIPLLDRDNVGIIVLLKSVDEPQLNLCVATTHLLFNPRRGDIKLAQLGVFLAEIDQVSHYRLEDGTFARCPVVLCGDMNSVPQSPLSEFIQKGTLDFKDIPCGDISGQTEGRRGAVRFLNRPAIPQALKITKDCQYMSALEERGEGRSKQEESKSAEKSQGEREEKNEDGEE